MFGLGMGSADNKEEGKRLFELDLKAAAAFKSNEALELYGRSIKASDNLSPYINRANLTALREEYATHYHNNCVSQGSFNSADRWVAVLDSL